MLVRNGKQLASGTDQEERGTGAACTLGSEVAADVDSVAAGEQLACAER